MRVAILTIAACISIASGAAAQPAQTSVAATDPAINSAADALALLRSRSFPASSGPKMLELLQAAVAAEPAKADWHIGLAYLGMSRMCPATLARDSARKATELSPNSAECWACRGTAVFMSINDAGLADKMSLADEGEQAYLKAVALDTNNLVARIGLTQFYINAPGIAGGSYKKAREQANAIKAIKGEEFKGQLLLAQIESEDGNYKKAAAAYDDTLKFAKTDQEIALVHFGHADMLLNKKEDADAAIEYLIPKIESLKESGTTLRYLLGKAFQENKKWAEAQAQYELVLKANPKARNTGFALAEVLRKQKNYAESAAAFRAFAKEFPTDERAAKAIEEAEDCESRK